MCKKPTVTRTYSIWCSSFVGPKSVCYPKKSIYRGSTWVFPFRPTREIASTSCTIRVFCFRATGGWLKRLLKRINHPPVGLAGVWIDLQKRLDAKELAKEVAVAATMNVGVVTRGAPCHYKRVARWVAGAPTSCLLHFLKPIHVASSVACRPAYWEIFLNPLLFNLLTYCLCSMPSSLVPMPFNDKALYAEVILKHVFM
jgi:hypothetical protein